MTDLTDAVRAEIEAVHRFFVDWFAAAVPATALEGLLARIDSAFFYVTPDGNRLTCTDLAAMLQGAHGANPDFRIAVRDVRVRHQTAGHVLATYTEWQKGARASQAENARVTTVLLTRDQPFKWCHIHETWLPEAVRAAGAFDFN